jgi:ribosome-associated protein
MGKRKVDQDKVLTENIVEGILKIKGKKITSIHLGKLENAICQYFIICSGESNTQVSSIADSLIDEVKKKSGIRPYHSEGYENAQWVLIDYGSVVVHVFQNAYRDFYRLEELWADGEVSYITKE